MSDIHPLEYNGVRHEPRCKLLHPPVFQVSRPSCSCGAEASTLRAQLAEAQSARATQAEHLQQYRRELNDALYLLKESTVEVERLRAQLAAYQRDLRCTGCGSTDTIEQIKAKHPNALSCCPERDMQSAKLQDQLAEAQRKIIESDGDCVLCELGVSTFDASGITYHRAKLRITDECIRCPQASPNIPSLAATRERVRELEAQLAEAQRQRDDLAKVVELAKRHIQNRNLKPLPGCVCIEHQMMEALALLPSSGGS